MELDQVKLLETFRVELDERLQEITNGLLKLEDKDSSNEKINSIIESIFRSAHNIKGAASSIDIKMIAEIAHHIESLFSRIQKNTSLLTPIIIDLCLECVDAMRLSMVSYMENKPLTFDINNLLERLGGNSGTLKVPVKQDQHTLQAADTRTIHVSIDNLDNVSAILEEIQINKIVIDDYYTELTKITSKSKELSQAMQQLHNSIQNNSSSEVSEKNYHQSNDMIMEMNFRLNQLLRNMRTCVKDLGILTDTLQDEVRTLRLLPASVLLQSLPRLVRDIANELHKKVDFDFTGETVKIDKVVLEGLKDPINHLLRNAIDHGIEDSETRRLKNKPEKGHVHISIIEEGDFILISISDDGEGIDPDEIIATAKSKNLLTTTELNNLSENEVLDLIFQPGFSTKKIITNVSGRGVGLDVVKSNIQKLKGQVSLKTHKGEGTTFYLRVPLTLASERGLLIKCGGFSWVIPTSLVERVLSLHPADINEVESTQTIIFDHHTIPLKLLTDVLGLESPPSTTADMLQIIVIKKDTQIIAFLVDEIMGEREIVIKPLQEPLINIPCVVGGTLAANGEAIIVLNTSDLLQHAMQSQKSLEMALSNETTTTKTRIHILVVDDSITTRTLEKNILENKGFQVTTAVNGKEAWDLLQSQTFDLLITDVMMPIIDGFELTEKVKQNPELRDLPVIIVTSLGSESEKARGIKVGANAYIVKNEFESEKLLDIVGQLL